MKVSNQRPASRLKNASEFSYVFEDAKAVHGRFFTLLFRSYNMNAARLGVVVSKKNVGQAVTRNRLKRVMRESFRQATEILPKVDIIVLAKRGAGKQANQELFQDLSKIWQKLIKIK